MRYLVNMYWLLASTYFYDEDGRMKLELILDNLKRKYNYGRYVGQDGIY